MLVAGAQSLGCELSDQHTQSLLDYAQLLNKWNRVFNLTAIEEPQAMLSKHLLDSLAVAKYIKGHTLLDVGSGAGLPGIPLAIVNPELAVTLLDSNGKKTRFLTQVLIKLGLQNVQIKTMRVEDYAPPSRFDTVIARAFASLADFVQSSGHLCQRQMLAMRGRLIQEEKSWQNADFYVESSFELKIPGLDAERSLLSLCPKSDPRNGQGQTLAGNH